MWVPIDLPMIRCQCQDILVVKAHLTHINHNQRVDKKTVLLTRQGLSDLLLLLHLSFFYHLICHNKQTLLIRRPVNANMGTGSVYKATLYPPPSMRSFWIGPNAHTSPSLS